MLPIERLELAIYRRIKSQSFSPVPVPVTLTSFHPEDPAQVAEAVLGLEKAKMVELSKFFGNSVVEFETADEAFPGYNLKRNFLTNGEFRIKVTPEGRRHFQALEARDEQERLQPTVFISCGQFHPNEKALGKKIETLVNTLTGCKGYFAENQSSVQALSDHVFRALDRCAGLVAVMHHRGTVQTLAGATHVRGSVWVEQEIAVAAFIAATRQAEIPVVLYVQEGIKREGVRDFLILNTVEFKNDSEVLADFEARIKDGRFKPAIPA
jgi:hypothetical protein